jgi:hypothetical protein
MIRLVEVCLTRDVVINMLPSAEGGGSVYAIACIGYVRMFILCGLRGLDYRAHVYNTMSKHTIANGIIYRSRLVTSYDVTRLSPSGQVTHHGR